MTAAITGTAGGIVSNKIAVVAAVLELPTESTAVTLKLFAPSFRLTDACQVVDDRMLTPVVPPLTLITAASDAFVPVRSCEVTFVGDVTALITGTAGGIVSSVMADWEAKRYDWLPLCRHGSSWKSQDAHPHPIFNHAADAVYFTSDKTGKRAVYRVDAPVAK